MSSHDMFKTLPQRVNMPNLIIYSVGMAVLMTFILFYITVDAAY